MLHYFTVYELNAVLKYNFNDSSKMQYLSCLPENCNLSSMNVSIVALPKVHLHSLAVSADSITTRKDKALKDDATQCYSCTKIARIGLNLKILIFWF